MRSSKHGFTLIELMIVVAILGILAAMAVPAFVQYVRRSKTAEAHTQLSAMFTAAAAYYGHERAEGPGIDAEMHTHCSVASAKRSRTPSDDKGAGEWDESFRAIGFAVEKAYFGYSLESLPGAKCSNAASSPIYLLKAEGDLDNDGTLSLFQLAVNSNDDNELYHAASVYVQRETE